MKLKRLKSWCFEERKVQRRIALLKELEAVAWPVNCTPNRAVGEAYHRYPFGLLVKKRERALRLTVESHEDARLAMYRYGRQHHVRLASTVLSPTELLVWLNPRPRRARV